MLKSTGKFAPFEKFNLFIFNKMKIWNILSISIIHYHPNKYTDIVRYGLFFF